MDSADWKDTAFVARHIPVEFRGKHVKGRYDVVGKEMTVSRNLTRIAGNITDHFRNEATWILSKDI
jgi:hypothetical protein